MPNNYIGIDPDVDKSGVAYYDKRTKKLELYNMTFFQLFDYLKSMKDVLVVIEAGWLNKSNWHKMVNRNASINSQIGQRTGANHEVGKKIVEMCTYLGIDNQLVKPTKSKVNAQKFAEITGIKGRTNQEMRDAGMLVYSR